jgi:hypothetical protein
VRISGRVRAGNIRALSHERPGWLLRFIGFGHSHIVALATGAYALEAEGFRLGDEPIAGRFHYLYDDPFEPAFASVDGATRLNPAIRDILAGDDHEFVIACLGGNEHNVLSIARTDPKYDYISGREPEASLDPEAQFVPEALIRETLRGWMSPSITLLSLLKDATRRPLIVAAPPPPLPQARVRAVPKEFFNSIFDRRRLNDDRIRRKMWLTQLSLISDLCRERELAFIEPPQEVFGDDGLLGPEFWGQDASHGNEEYGRRMIGHIFARVAEILGRQAPILAPGG